MKLNSTQTTAIDWVLLSDSPSDLLVPINEGQTDPVISNLHQAMESHIRGEQPDWLTHSEGAAGGGLFADGDAVPGDGGVWLWEQALGRAASLAQHRGAAGLLVRLHPAEALSVHQGDLLGGKAQDQQVHPDIGRPSVALEFYIFISENCSESPQETGEGDNCHSLFH